MQLELPFGATWAPAPHRLAHFGAMHCTCLGTATRCGRRRTARPLQEPVLLFHLLPAHHPQWEFQNEPQTACRFCKHCSVVSEARGLLSPGGMPGWRGWLEAKVLEGLQSQEQRTALLLPFALQPRCGHPAHCSLWQQLQTG